jgi:hypothetical protein
MVAGKSDCSGSVMGKCLRVEIAPKLECLALMSTAGVRRL